MIRDLPSFIRPLDTSTKRPPDKKADPFYLSPAWREFMSLVIAKRGMRCEDPACETPRGPWPRIVGDHIVEIRDGGAKLDEKNILLRCAPCHARKTARAKKRRQLDR